MDYKTSLGMAVPKGTPSVVVQKIQADVKAVLFSKEFADRVLTPNELETAAGVAVD